MQPSSSEVKSLAATTVPLSSSFCSTDLHGGWVEHCFCSLARSLRHPARALVRVRSHVPGSVESSRTAVSSDSSFSGKGTTHEVRLARTNENLGTRSR
eukprot:621617-Pleurochrysis_carterae.AAC.1